MANTQYNATDAWLLTTLFFFNSEKISDLCQVIGCGDWINHAIFLYEELEEGLSKLVDAGFIACDNKEITLAARALELKADIFGDKKTVSPNKVLNSVQKHLSTLCPHEIRLQSDTGQAGREAFFSREEFERAVRNYLKK